MNPDNKLSFAQVFMMLMLMNGLACHVIVNPMILDASGRDSWITVLVTGIVLLVWMMLLAFIMRRSGQQEFKTWLARRISPVGAWLLILPVCVQMYLIGGMTVVHTTSWHITNYLPATPKLLLAFALVLFCCFITLWGLNVIAILSGVLLPLVVVLGIFVSSFNTPMKDYALLRPMFEHGWGPVLAGMVYAGAGFVELVVLIMMQHRIKTKVRVWHLLLYGIATVIITLGPIIGAITEFGPEEAANQMTSPYEQWRLVRIGLYVEHLDFLSIFQWLSGACVRISLSVYLFVETLSIRKDRVRVWIIIAVTASYILLSLIPINEYSFYLWLYRYYMPVSLIVILTLSFFWMIVALFSRPAQEEAT